ncbi:DoxX family protein [Candidatus Woesearchaeota archaeon]|nr:DoxX family protein [Candidatus Woesearchaeota archaeon]
MVNRLPNTKVQDASLLLLRLIVAAIFLYAAYGKWVFLSAAPTGTSATMLYLLKFLTIVEPLGAVALLAGFLTRWAAAGLAIIMVGAIFFLRATMNVSFFTAQQAPGWDYNLLILGCCIALLAFGAGRWSVDSARKKT